MTTARFLPLVPPAPGAADAPLAPAPTTDWFDDTAPPALCIAAACSAAARGLPVAAHAERVLAALCQPTQEG